MDGWIRNIRASVGQALIFVPSAAGVVIDERGRVLLQKRSATEESWGFPGGILDLGESFEEGAIREIHEETGLEVCAVQLLGIYSKYLETCPNGDKCQPITAIFEMRPVGGELKIDNEETFDLRYFDLTEMPPLYSPKHQAILDDVLKGHGPVFR